MTVTANDRVLESKTLLVTGAAQGIGLAIARQAAAAGACVVVADIARSPEGGTTRFLAEQVVAEIQAAGGQAVAAAEDIASKAGATRVVAAALDSFGRIDAVVNNAGILRDRMFFNMEDDEWRAVIDVHLNGYYHVSRAAAPHFRAQNGGSYLHFGSSSGLIGNVGQANYAAAKMGVVGLSTGIALDMAKFNVRSNVIAPWAWSQLLESVPIRSVEHGERMRRMKAHMRPEQIAPLCLYLVSDHAAGISGQIFGARGNEIYLFSQPRIVRSLHRADGWDLTRLAATLQPSLANAFTPLQSHREVVGWDPI
jgi:NAD(P)-dependent dehydrogenase (short-subunit alcohol dehydrogenase family)